MGSHPHHLQAELVKAQAIAEEKARELAVANGLVAEKTRQYAEVQRIAAESEQSAAALEDKFKMQMLETKAERCVLRLGTNSCTNLSHASCFCIMQPCVPVVSRSFAIALPCCNLRIFCSVPYLVSDCLDLSVSHNIDYTALWGNPGRDSNTSVQ
jgi:hypothetical protein